jgi:hypothetical protein
MIIDHKKWDAIVAFIKTEIDRANNGFDAKALAREIETGEIRSTRAVRKNGRVTGFKITTPDPKAWKSLVDKSAQEVARGVGLLNFQYGWVVTTTGSTQFDIGPTSA